MQGHLHLQKQSTLENEFNSLGLHLVYPKDRPVGHDGLRMSRNFWPYVAQGGRGMGRYGGGKGVERGGEGQGLEVGEVGRGGAEMDRGWDIIGLWKVGMGRSERGDRVGLGTVVMGRVG